MVDSELFAHERLVAFPRFDQESFQVFVVEIACSRIQLWSVFRGKFVVDSTRDSRPNFRKVSGSSTRDFDNKLSSRILTKSLLSVSKIDNKFLPNFFAQNRSTKQQKSTTNFPADFLPKLSCQNPMFVVSTFAKNLAQNRSGKQEIPTTDFCEEKRRKSVVKIPCSPTNFRQMTEKTGG